MKKENKYSKENMLNDLYTWVDSNKERSLLEVQQYCKESIEYHKMLFNRKISYGNVKKNEKIKKMLEANKVFLMRLISTTK